MTFQRLLIAGLLTGCLGMMDRVLTHAAEALTVQSNTHVELLGVARIPGTTIDLSGQSVTLEDGSRADYLGGMSAIDYTNHDNRFIILADRGAGDGAVSYACRYHEVELVLDQTDKSIQFQLMATHLFKSSKHEQLTGSLAVHEKELQGKGCKVLYANRNGPPLILKEFVN